MHKILKTSSDSEFFQEANDAIGFLKSHCKMEVQTVTVFELAIAGKLRAVLFLRPFFTAFSFEDMYLSQSKKDALMRLFAV